jgi:redox-sensitive bicupin YhaK (pirin superfamily)
MLNKSIINHFSLDLHWKTQNPFLFCAFHNDRFPKGNGKLGPSVGLEGRAIGSDFQLKDGYRMYHGSGVPGFPAHPHSGFETITIVNKGFVDHADSLGNGGRYGGGDCQWMTAGHGIVHSEMFPLVNTEKENPLELLQIWLNLPSASKKVAPNYNVYSSQKTKTVVLDSKRVNIKLYSGSIGETKGNTPPKNSWASTEKNEICVWLIEIKHSGKFTIPKAKNSNSLTSLYFYEGENIAIHDNNFGKMTGFELNSNEEVLVENISDQTAKLLLLRGAPIDEPVIQHGPFVANSREGLIEIVNRYNQTQFGGWPWKSSDVTHGKKAESFELKVKS